MNPIADLPEDRRNRARAVASETGTAGLRLVWDRDQPVDTGTGNVRASRDGLMLCVGVTPGEDGEADLMWVHTAQGALLLAAEGEEIHRALGCFAPLTDLPADDVSRFLARFNTLTADLFAASERPAEVRSTTPVRVSLDELARMLRAEAQAA